MNIQAYMNPDFTWPKKLLFFAVALAGVLAVTFLIYGWSRFGKRVKNDHKDPQKVYENMLYRFYELIISATSVMSFACAYVVMNHVYSLYEGTTDTGAMGIFLNIWGNWKDFALLFLICLSCGINTFLDKLIIPLKGITRDQIAVIRMLGMFYAIIVILYMNVIGDSNEYSPVMIYYLGLMVGRFVYFDASFKDFLKAMKNMFFCAPLLIMGLTLSGLVSWFGFGTGFLLERNYYIVGVFYTHLFLLAAVFAAFHGGNIIAKIRRSKSKKSSGEKSSGKKSAN